MYKRQALNSAVLALFAIVPGARFSAGERSVHVPALKGSLDCTWKKSELVVGIRINAVFKEQEGKRKQKLLVHGGSRQHLTCSCLLAYVVALSTRTYCCMYFVCCSVQGRLQTVLLCLRVRYVDTVAIGAWFVPTWCAQKNQVQKQNKRKNEKTKDENKQKSLGIDPEKIISPSAITD